jgi:hypothetical protein
MAGLGRKTFAQEEILRAADVNGYLMDQSVMRFADSAARGSAIGTAVAEGMVSYLDDANAVEVYDGSDWKSVGQDLTTGTEGFTALSAGTAGISYQPVSHNYIINGAFDVWQRGTSFTTTTQGSYTADRWQFLYTTGAVPSILYTQESFSPGAAPEPGYESQFFLKQKIVTVGGGPATYVSVCNNVEDVRSLAGQTATLSFWAKTSAATSSNLIQVRQFFGTGGSATTFAGTLVFSTTTNWQRFTFTVPIPSIAGKTIGPNSYLQARIGTQNIAADFEFDIWGVQLEAGSVATPFKRHAPSLQGELAACQRYFERINFNGSSVGIIGSGWVNSTTRAWYLIPFRQKRGPTGGSIDVTFSSNTGFRVYHGSATATTSTAMARVGSTTTLTSTGVLADVASGLTVGQGSLLAVNSASDYIDISNEL